MHRIPQAKTPAYRRPSESGATGAAPALAVPDLSALDLHAGTAAGRPLSDVQCKLLYWAARGATLDGAAARLGLPVGEVLESLAPLSEAGLVELRPAPRAARRDTLERIWDEAVAKHGERPFLVPSGGTALSYAAAAERVEAIGRRLAGAGLGKGSRILIQAETGVESALLFWAAVRLGIVVAVIDTSWGEAALLRALHLVRPALVFADPARAPLARAARRPVVVLEAAQGAPDRFAAWLAGGSGTEATAPVGEDDPAVILFTSGTTGAPKGVELTQGALVRTARLLAERCGIRAGDRLLTLAEGHSVSGLRNPLVLTAATGATAVLPAGAERRDPRAIAALCRRAGASVLSTVPACLKALAAAGEPLEGLRLILSTGAPLPAATAERLRGLTSAAVRTYYGLTETAGICVVEPPGGAAPGALGVPRGVVAQVVDGEGRVLPPGEAGELRIYGANLAGAFIGQPSPLRDGWLYTGDRALWRDGQLVLLGRLREALKTPRGDLLTFAEIEAVMERDPAVAEAAVRTIREEDGEGEERTLGFIRLVEGASAEGVVGRVMQRALEAFGPRAAPVAVRILDEFPRAANGKLRRAALPDHLSDA